MENLSPKEQIQGFIEQITKLNLDVYPVENWVDYIVEGLKPLCSKNPIKDIMEKDNNPAAAFFSSINKDEIASLVKDKKGFELLTGIAKELWDYAKQQKNQEVIQRIEFFFEGLRKRAPKNDMVK